MSDGSVDDPNGSQEVYGNPLPILRNTTWTHDVPSIISSLSNSTSFLPINSSGTNVSCSGSPVSCSGSDVNLGDYPSAVKYYYSEGDLQISSNSSHGYGILLVKGDLTFHGGFSFRGLIICSGTVNFTGGGSDDVNIHGAIIAGDSVTDTTSDIGGSINIHYNACDIQNVYDNLPLTVITFKDRAIY